MRACPHPVSPTEVGSGTNRRKAELLFRGIQSVPWRPLSQWKLSAAANESRSLASLLMTNTQTKDLAGYIWSLSFQFQPRNRGPVLVMTSPKGW